MELSDKSLNIDKLRGKKQLRKIFKLELFSIGFVNSGDSASTEASNIESETEQKQALARGQCLCPEKGRRKKETC